MPLPLPPAFRKKMAAPGEDPGASASDGASDPIGEPSASDAPQAAAGAANPLKNWAAKKLGGGR